MVKIILKSGKEIKVKKIITHEAISTWIEKKENELIIFGRRGSGEFVYSVRASEIAAITE